MSSSAKQNAGLLAPLSFNSFRWAWFAGLITNVGTFMQAVAAAWLMTTLNPSAFMVAMVQVATTAPVFVFAPIAGSAADLFDRRRLLIAMQLLMFAAAGYLAFATHFHIVSADVLLVVSAIMAVGSALTIPSWDTMMLELVDSSLLRQSITLNGVGMNAARAIGPALAGLIVAQFGTAPVFLLNALSFLGVALVAYSLRMHDQRTPLVGERLFSNVRLGMNFVAHSPVLHPILLRSFAYTAAASCLSALLPIYIKNQLQAGPQSLGLLFACFGIGAIVGAYPMHKLQGKTDKAVNLATACGGVSFLLLGYSNSMVVASMACAMAGISWLIVQANGYAAMQAASPQWMRGRMVSLNMLLLNGSIASGSFVWGSIASFHDVSFALVMAGICLLATLLLHGYKFTPALSRNIEPVLFWGAPIIVEEFVAAQSDKTPVNIIIEYTVPLENQTEFQQVIRQLKQSRLRAGAMRWEFCRDSEVLDKFIESFVAENWQQHLRHHQQTLEEDRLIESRVHALLSPDSAPKVSHWTIEQI